MSAKSEDELQQLLDGLQNRNWYDRQQALKGLTPEQLQDDRIQATVKSISQNDSKSALQTLAASLLGQEIELPITEPAGPPAWEPRALPEEIFTEKEVKDLIGRMEADDASVRLAAVESVGRYRQLDKHLSVVLNQLAKFDADRTVREAASRVRAAASPLQSVSASGKPQDSRKRSVMSTDGFWLGFFGFFIVNGLLLGSFTSGPTAYNSSGQFASLLPYVLLPLNIAMPMILGLTGRNNVAVGIVAAWAAALALVVCAGVLLSVACGSRL